MIGLAKSRVFAVSNPLPHSSPGRGLPDHFDWFSHDQYVLGIKYNAGTLLRSGSQHSNILGIDVDRGDTISFGVLDVKRDILGIVLARSRFAWRLVA